MKNINFLPQDDIIELMPSIATIQFTRNYADYVEQMPIPKLHSEGIDDVEIVGEIRMLQDRINTEYPQIQKLAGDWFGVTENDITKIFIDLQHFANVEFHSYYDYISHHNNSKSFASLRESLKKLLDLILNKQLNAKQALSALVVYEGDLSNYRVVLANTYTQAKSSLSNLSKYTSELESKRAQLQAKLKANNKAVADIALKEAKDVVKNGVAISTSIATEKYGEALKTGSILAMNAAEAGVNIVALDIESIQLIDDIQKLSEKLSPVERDLQVLNNAVAQMDSINQSHEFSKVIVKTLESYWEEMHKYIADLLEQTNKNKPLDLPAAKSLEASWISTIANPLKHILSFSNLSSLSEWDVNEITFKPIDS